MSRVKEEHVYARPVQFIDEVDGNIEHRARVVQKNAYVNALFCLVDKDFVKLRPEHSFPKYEEGQENILLCFFES